MVRTPSYDKSGLKKGTWTPEEDRKLIAYVTRYGCWNWRQLPRFAGLARCGKSCRLRWMNYLRPNIKRGNYTPEEEDLIIKLHQDLGNRWSAIAAHLPGRTDNEIKNHWHTTLKKRFSHHSGERQKSKNSKLDASTPKKSSHLSSSSSSQMVQILDSGPFSPQSSSSCISSCVNSGPGEDDLSFLDALKEPDETQNFSWAPLNLDDMFCDPTETPSAVIPHQDDFAFLDSISQEPFCSFLMETQMPADVSYPYPPTQSQAPTMGAELEYLSPLYELDLWSQSNLYV